MIVFGVYDPIWLALGMGMIIPAVFLASCRQSLHRFSRKAYEEMSRERGEKKLQEILSLRDEYLANLKLPVRVLQLGIVVTLSYGRWLSLDAPAANIGVSLINAFLVTVEIFFIGAVFFNFLPSLLARVAAERWLRRFQPLIHFVYRVIEPPRLMLSSSEKILASLFGSRAEPTSADLAEEEILTAVEEGQREGILESQDRHMIESIMGFGEVKVSEVMTPRTDMLALDIDDPLEENLKIVVDCGHSRIPVFRDSKDQIVGILYVKDLQKFWQRREEIDLENILRPPYFVEEDAKIDDLLQQFKGHRQHLALVRDGHGGTAGLVTIEDIIEEILGDITDEYESTENHVTRLEGQLVEVDASIHIDDLNEQLGVEIPESDTYDTLGGYILEASERVPSIGDSLDLDGIHFEVIKVDDRRVHRLRLRLKSPPPRTSPLL